MLGTIGFKGYCVNCIIGTEIHERDKMQNLIIDLKVEIDFSRVGESDHLQDTVNYLSLADLCQSLAHRGKYLLMEKYAFDITEEILNLFPIKSVWVSIKKPLAIPHAEYALVELKREC